MRASGFTLVELLVVVAIVALLVAMLAPGVARTADLGRSVRCRHNLHEIGQAFCAAAAVAPEGGKSSLYPRPDAWPGIPMNVVPDEGIYLCPAEPRRLSGSRQYKIYCEIPDAYIDFEEGPYCRVSGHGGHTRYCFEVYTGPDWNDAIFDVTDDWPRVATFSADSHISRSVYLRRGGKPIPGWESELGPTDFGRKIAFAGGLTNYGINARISTSDADPNTVVLLDYGAVIANNGEDMQILLCESARHLGKLNVLLADQSVRRMGPEELNPAVGQRNAALWLPSQ